MKEQTQYRVLQAFYWFRRGEIITPDRFRHLDYRYLVKKQMIEVYEGERAVAPEPEVETRAEPKRKRKQA